MFDIFVFFFQYLKDVGGDHFYTIDAAEIGTTIPGVKGKFG